MSTDMRVSMVPIFRVLGGSLNGWTVTPGIWVYKGLRVRKLDGETRTLILDTLGWLGNFGFEEARKATSLGLKFEWEAASS